MVPVSVIVLCCYPWSSAGECMVVFQGYWQVHAQVLVVAIGQLASVPLVFPLDGIIWIYCSKSKSGLPIIAKQSLGSTCGYVPLTTPT